MKNNHTKTKVIPHTRATVAVHLILLDGNKILLMRRKNTGYQDGNWQVPSGHVMEGETPTGAMVRKAREEIALTIDHTELQHVHTSYRVKHDETGTRVDIFFRASLNARHVAIGSLQHCDRLKWYYPETLPEDTTPHIADAIIASGRGIIFAEHSLAYVMGNPLYGMAAK
ncbi:MAG: NUDIX domain-containing protein [Patescibacteria group bacterium]